DMWETAQAWRTALQRKSGPTAIVLTRQKLPEINRALAGGTAQGAYIIVDVEDPQLVLIGTGSEVHIALAAQESLVATGIRARVVSMPSWALFEATPQAYQDQVLPPSLTARVAVEAGCRLGWERYVGREGVVIGIDRFGTSGPYEEVYAALGVTAEAVVAAAKELI
ncbi:MAG: transketolase, partial [Chloroflexota bacterium]